MKKEKHVSIKGTKIFKEYLEEKRVKYIFGIPGDEDGFLSELKYSNIIFCPTRHEHAAGFMADAYSRVTGKTGVCYATYGPGTLNLITGLANALLDRYPIVAFIAELPKHYNHLNGHQNIDLASILTTVTKKVIKPDSVKNLKNSLMDAFNVAESNLPEPPGPVAVILSDAVLHSSIKYDKRHNEHKVIKDTQNKRDVGKERKKIEKAKRILSNAKNPVAIVGGIANRYNLKSKVFRLLKKLNIPVYVTLMGKGSIPEDSNVFCGVLNRSLDSKTLNIFKNVDVFLHIGFDPVEGIYPRYYTNWNKKIIHIGFNTCEKGVYVPDVSFHGIFDFYLDELSQLSNVNPTFETNKSIYAIKNGNCDINPELISIIDKISQLQKYYSDLMYFCDVGINKYLMAYFCKAFSNGSFYFTNGLSAMGFSVPSAISAQLIYPSKTVLSISGDGGFLMNVQELEIVKRYNLKVIFIVLKNNAFGLIRKNQIAKFNSDYGTVFTNPCFKKLAQAFDLQYFSVDDALDMNNVIKHFPVRKKSFLIVINDK